MKKALVTIVIVAVLACALAFAASAADFEDVADELNALGLFKGTDDGYDLDRAPTRIEGLVMLLRMLGLEEDALACEAENPFTDVSGWQTPYVAYAYASGLTNGTTDTTYSPGAVCNAQMYVTFVLRALGYSSDEGGDFTYAGALEFGAGIGVFYDALAGGDFLRDQMVAVSYLALAAAPKDGEFNCLLEKLVAGGAVSEEAAAVLLGKWALMAEFSMIGLGGGEDDFSRIAMAMKIGADIGILGSATIDMEMNMIMEDEDILASIEMSMNVSGALLTGFIGEGMSMSAYIVDGYVYVDADGEKTKVEAGVSDMSGMLDSIDVAQIELSPFIISGISKTVEGEFTVFTLTYADEFMDTAMGIASGMTGMMGVDASLLDDMDMTFSIGDVKYYVDSDGALVKCVMELVARAVVEMSGIKMPVTVKLNIELEIIAVGDAVTVELPGDLDEYTERSTGAADAAA